MFAIGMVIQAFLMLSGTLKKEDWKGFLIAFGGGLLGMIPARSENLNEYNLSFHLFLTVLLGASFFTGIFRHRLISRIGARTILIFNILLLYLIYDRFGFSYFLFGLFLIPTLITLINGFSGIDASFNWQVFFYVWFSLIVIAIGLMHFAFGDFYQIFFGSSGNRESSLLSFILAGAAFLYIISNVWYVIMLMPMQAKHQSWPERRRNIQRHMHLLAHGYVWQKGDWVGNLITVLIFPLIIFLNYQLKVFDESIFVSLIVVLTPIAAGSILKTHDDGIGDLNQAGLDDFLVYK